MNEPAWRRVILVVDTGDRTEVHAREAARLADALHVALEARFVEDEDLLRWAGHGFAQRIGRTAAPHPVEADELEREWRALRLHARRAVEREATQRKVEARFEVRRGSGRRFALRDALGEGDVCVVAWGGWAPRAERTAPVRVLHDGSEASGRAIELAARLSGPGGKLIVLLAPGVALDDAPSDGFELRVVALSDLAPSTVRREVARQPGGLLLVPAGDPIAERLADRSVAARFSATVLVVG